MPRRLLRDGQIVLDEWSYVAEAPGNGPAPVIVGFDQFQQERDVWVRRGGRLGLLLAPAHIVEQVVPDLKLFELIAAEFTGPSEGRGYTQARLLRERWHFAGELRATGFVHRDQLFFMARCGFNSFEVAEADLDAASSALTTFSAAYQVSNDRGLKIKLQHQPDTPASA